jgi:hypothetical protein
MAEYIWQNPPTWFSVFGGYVSQVITSPFFAVVFGAYYMARKQALDQERRRKDFQLQLNQK